MEKKVWKVWSRVEQQGAVTVGCRGGLFSIIQG